MPSCISHPFISPSFLNIPTPPRPNPESIPQPPRQSRAPTRLLCILNTIARSLAFSARLFAQLAEGSDAFVWGRRAQAVQVEEARGAAALGWVLRCGGVGGVGGGFGGVEGWGEFVGFGARDGFVCYWAEVVAAGWLG